MEIEWDVAITLIIASYGALLSTYSIWNKRQEQRRKIKVELSYGLLRAGLTSDVSSVLIISAKNTGRKTVTLSSMGLVLPDKKYLAFLYPKSNVSFPYDLPEGKDCNVWIETEELTKDLKKGGYSGKISLIGYYKDAIGGMYKSKSLKFDTEKP